MAEKEQYAWHFVNGKTYVGTPGNKYGVNPETGEVELSRLYEVGFDSCGNPTCSCPNQRPLCKHIESWRIDWACRIPAQNTFATASAAAAPVESNREWVAANIGRDF